MPLPLLVPIAVGIAGVFGAGKAIVAVADNDEASALTGQTDTKVYEILTAIETGRKTCQDTLETLGKKKFYAVTNTLNQFVDVYSQLKNVELLLDSDLGNLKLSNFDEHVLQEIRDNSISMLASSGVGIASGALSGGMAAFGAYSGTMMMASAGTGTAIGTLSGAAATNATLAWLGGGTLASGGMGVAGGLTVLGIAVVGPVLLVFGSVVGNKAEARLNNAKAYDNEADVFVAEGKTIVTKLNGISDVALIASKVLSSVKTDCRRHCNQLLEIMETSGKDYSAFTNEQKAVVFKTVKLAQLIKAIVDTPILDEGGNLLGDVDANIRSVETVVAEL